MVRGREGGQVLPLVALALLAGSLLAYAVVRSAATFYERTKFQTMVDATALAAATAYARGLNVCAASNRLLAPAAAADAIRALAGQPPLFVPLVVKFQDAWAGTGSLAWVTESAGIAPIYMQSVAHSVGASNGLRVAAFWNGEGSAGGTAPSLNVKRATPVDLALWLAGLHPTSTPGGGTVRARWGKELKEKRFSYLPKGGGSRVEVPKEQVEKVQYKSRGKTETRYRIKSAPGQKAGKFVRRETIGKRIGGSFPLPMPLIEKTPIHRVLIVGVPVRGNAGLSFLPRAFAVQARGEAGNGLVFSALLGDPEFEARLIPLESAALEGEPESSLLAGLLRSDFPSGK